MSAMQNNHMMNLAQAMGLANASQMLNQVVQPPKDAVRFQSYAVAVTDQSTKNGTPTYREGDAKVECFAVGKVPTDYSVDIPVYIEYGDIPEPWKYKAQCLSAGYSGIHDGSTLAIDGAGTVRSICGGAVLYFCIYTT